MILRTLALLILASPAFAASASAPPFNGGTIGAATSVVISTPSSNYSLRAGTSTTPSALFVSSTGRVGFQIDPESLAPVPGRAFFNVAGISNRYFQAITGGGFNIQSMTNNGLSLNVSYVAAPTFTANTVPTWSVQLASGTIFAPAAIGNGYTGQFDMRGHTGSAFTGSRARLQMASCEQWTPTANCTRMIFAVTSSGTATATDRMVIENNGNIGIGASAPATKLHISSGVITNDGTGSVPAGFALCFTASGAMGHCTSVVGVAGDCTCSSP